MRAPDDPPSSDLAALIAGLITVTLWGSAFVGIRAAGASFSPGGLALGRLLVSSVILGTIALFRRDPIPPRRDLVPIAAYGILWLALYSVTLNAAERLIDAGTAAMLINLGPILIAILAGIFLREGFPPMLFAGCAVAFAGCALIGLAATHARGNAAGGIALCILGAMAYASGVVVQKPVLSRVPAMQVVWLGCVAATVACLPFAPALAHDLSKADARAIGWLLYLGSMPTTLGFVTWSFALKRTSAGRLASLTYLIPLVAIVLGWVLLGERPVGPAVAGGALCVAGVWIARRPSRGGTPSRLTRGRRP